MLDNYTDKTGKIITDGNEVRSFYKNYFVFSVKYSVQFYGTDKFGQKTFKHFLVIRYLWIQYSWTFRTKDHAYSLPYKNNSLGLWLTSYKRGKIIGWLGWLYTKRKLRLAK